MICSKIYCGSHQYFHIIGKQLPNFQSLFYVLHLYVCMHISMFLCMYNLSNVHIYRHIHACIVRIGYKSRIDEFKKESQKLLSKQHFDSTVIIEKMTLVEQHYTELTQLASLRKNHLTESKQLHEFKRLVF